jgi:hypothetical protein
MAQIVRKGWFREVAVKGLPAGPCWMPRTPLIARAHLVNQRHAAANTIRGLMKTLGSSPHAVLHVSFDETLSGVFRGR